MTPRPLHSPRFREAIRSLKLVVPGLALLLLAAAPRPASASVMSYLRDRGQDFLDIFRVRYVVPYRGDGYGIKARVTALAQAGYVHVNGDAYGMDRRAIGHTTEKRTEGGVSVFYFSRTQMAKVSGNEFLDADNAWSQAAPRGIVRQGGHWDDGRLHPASVGAEVELGLFGLDVGVYPTEAIDFVTGIVGFDVYKDDLSYTEGLPEYGTELKAEKAGTNAEEGVTSPGAPSSQGTFLLPESPEAPSTTEPATSEPPAAAPPTSMNQPSDSTLGSEFVSPQEVKELKSGEAAPDTQNVQTPLTPDSESSSAPETAPAPTPLPTENAPSPGEPTQ